MLGGSEGGISGDGSIEGGGVIGGRGGGGGEFSGGMGGPMTSGATAKLKADESAPRALASASGNAFAVMSANCASCEVADPKLVTVIEASTLESVLLVRTSVSETPSEVASADEFTVGAASDSLEEASIA